MLPQKDWIPFRVFPQDAGLHVEWTHLGGRRFREPLAWELELLEACLWMIPDFLKRAQDRKSDVYEYAFDGTIGRMSLDLAWERVGRSKSDQPE